MDTDYDLAEVSQVIDLLHFMRLCGLYTQPNFHYLDIAQICIAIVCQPMSGMEMIHYVERVIIPSVLLDEEISIVRIDERCVLIALAN